MTWDIKTMSTNDREQISAQLCREIPKLPQYLAMLGAASDIVGVLRKLTIRPQG